MENYAESKRRLFSDYSIKKAVINLDDDFGRELIAEFQNKIELVGYTLKPVSQNQIPVVSANIISSNASGMTLEVNSPWGEGTLTSGLIGQFNASNLLASLSALCLSGMPFAEALSALSKCSSVPGRMESFRQEGKPVVIVDYAHSPDALKQVLIDLKSQSSGKLVCVFGCGGDRDQGKRAEMGGIAEALADHIFLTNDNPRHESAEAIIEDIISGIKNHSCFTKELDRRNAIMAAIDSASSNDVVLIAGKGHEDYQEISGVRHPFSDRLIVQEILNLQKSGSAG
jgi:UDP-N-acetylmuramoyl-L-alanyl-D-glutamate--2,6-diaminopimelate ligase